SGTRCWAWCRLPLDRMTGNEAVQVDGTNPWRGGSPVRRVAISLVSAGVTGMLGNVGAAAVQVTPPLQVCLAAAADGSAVYPLNAVPMNLREVSAVFHLASNERFGTLTGTWVAVDVGQAAPPNYTVQTTSLSNAKAMDHGTFRVTLPRDFPAGKYRLDVTGDGKPWRSVEFTMVAASPPAASAAVLVPLLPKRVLTYDYRQEAGSGGRITDVPKGGTVGADGKIHAVVTATVAGADAGGAHVEWRRGDNLFSEEWWRIDASGASVTRRIVNGETTLLNPAQSILQWPIDKAVAWDY